MLADMTAILLLNLQHIYHTTENGDNIFQFVPKQNKLSYKFIKAIIK